MKYLFFTLLFAGSAHAADISIHNSSLFLSILFLALGILVIYAYHIHKCKQLNILLEEKGKKIKVLKENHSNHEKKILKKELEVEKEILVLNHTIENLQRQMQEGTKNQVVLKIEELEKKRHNRQNKSLDS